MASAQRIFTTRINFIIGCISMLMLAIVPAHVAIAQEEASRIQETFFRARVAEVLKSETVEEFGDSFRSQRVRATILEGEEKGNTVEVDYSVRTANSNESVLTAGDRIVIVRTEGGVDGVSYAVSDVYRLRAVWMMLAAFFLLCVLFGGKRGVFAFVGLGFTIMLLAQYMVPKIIGGSNPLIIGLSTALLIALISMYFAHGVRQRTTLALISTCLSVGLAYGLSTFLVWATNLSGMGSEEAFYLQFSPAGSIDPRGLLLGGMIIGALGVLDDITTAQAAAVEEIHLANTALNAKELYRRGLSVGKEHISSLVNTLVLAYVGASLPLLILFVIYARPWWVTLNSELVVEEIVRTIAGSMVLIVAVPLTTLIAAWWFGKQHKPVSHP